jgi:hypothetical protein
MMEQVVGAEGVARQETLAHQVMPKGGGAMRRSQMIVQQPLGGRLF